MERTCSKVHVFSYEWTWRKTIASPSSSFNTPHSCRKMCVLALLRASIVKLNTSKWSKLEWRVRCTSRRLSYILLYLFIINKKCGDWIKEIGDWRMVEDIVGEFKWSKDNWKCFVRCILLHYIVMWNCE